MFLRFEGGRKLRATELMRYATELKTQHLIKAKLDLIVKRYPLKGRRGRTIIPRLKFVTTPSLQAAYSLKEELLTLLPESFRRS